MDVSDQSARLSEIAEVVDVIKPVSRIEKPLFFVPIFDESLDRELEEGRWKNYLELFHRRKLPQEARIWRISECVCFPPAMLLTTTDLRVISETVRKQTLAKPKTWDHIESRLDQRGFIIGSGQHENYYHWMVELLPKISFARKRSVSDLILPHPNKSFQSQSLELFQNFSPNVAILKKPTLLRDVYFSENLASSNVRLSPQIVDFFRDFRRPISRNKKLFVSRANAKNRRIVNEAEIVDLFIKNGFDVLRPDEMTVVEQARHFAEAEIIVGPHGANLANIVFCGASTRIVEIVPSSFREGVTSYAALSELFSLDYSLCVANATEPDKGANSDIILSRSLAERILGSL